MQINCFWDIDQILAEEEKIHVTFLQKLSNVPQLKNAYDLENNDIEADYESEIPLWLVAVLYPKAIIKYTEPLYLNDYYQKALTADPISLNLKKKSTNFYYIGMFLSTLDILYNKKRDYKKTIDLLEVLAQVYSCRYSIIMDYTTNGKEDLPLKVYKKLCNSEMNLYLLKKEAMRCFNNWKERKINKIDISNSVLHYNKKMKLAP